MLDLPVEEQLKLLNEVEEGVLAFTNGTHPYCIPLGFVYIEGSIYISLFPKGRKMEYYLKNNNVCFNIFEWNKEHTGWGSVTIDGTLEEVKDLKVIEAVVKANMAKMQQPPDYLEKRMKYYTKTADNENALKIYKINTEKMGGKQRPATLTKPKD
ncbi:pyridoxamine 5'-phosphate oxidase family protein [Spirochaetota bacterium]